MNSKISQLFHKWRWGKNSREDGATVHLFFKLKPYNCKKRQNLLNFVLSLWCNLNIKSALKKPHELNIKTGLGQHKQWRNCITCNLISLTLHRRDPRDKVIKLHNGIRIIYDPLPWTKYSRGKFYLQSTNSHRFHDRNLQIVHKCIRFDIHIFLWCIQSIYGWAWHSSYMWQQQRP